MSEIVIVDNDYITVKYLEDKGIVYHTVKKPVPDQQFKDALNAGTDALIRYRACKWLSDNRKNGPVPADIAEWGRLDWNPRSIAAGWKYWANVVPQEVASAGSLAPVIENLYKLGLRTMVFADVSSATQWLDSMES